MPWTTTNVSMPGFIVDHNSVDRDTGRQIDWANVPDSFKNAEGKKVLPAGKIMAEMSGGKIVARSNIPGAQTAIGILASNAVEGAPHNAASGFGLLVGGVFYINLMPDKAHADLDDMQAELAAVGNFVWRTYADNRS